MDPSDNSKFGQSKRWLPMLAIACIAIAAGVYAGTRHGEKNTQESHTQQSTQALEAIQSKLESATMFPDDFKQLPVFSLPYGDEKLLSAADFEGKWSVVFFGFTHCPDICPNTLNEMNGVVSQLANDNAVIPQVVFITVDPVRDTVDKMAEYVNYFNDDFFGVSGNLTDITELTTKLGIVVSYTAQVSGGSDNSDTNSGNNYSVDHTASMLVIDPALRVRAKLNPPHKADTITADLKTIMALYN